MKLVINKCYGGFGLSEKALLRLIDLGVPVVPYFAQKRNPETGLLLPEPRNEGDIIIDYAHPECDWGDDRDRAERHVSFMGRYSASWLRDDKNRSHPLLVQVVESLGDEASGRFGRLRIVEVPDGVDFEIDDYDGQESIHEIHRSWT